jgi:hypothetical protein
LRSEKREKAFLMLYDSLYYESPVLLCFVLYFSFVSHCYYELLTVTANDVLGHKVLSFLGGVLGLAIILGVLCVAYASPHEDTFAA